MLENGGLTPLDSEGGASVFLHEIFRIYTFNFSDPLLLRICPGQHVAEDTLFINVATTLATLDISKGLDKNGLPIEPDLNYIPGVILYEISIPLAFLGY